MAGRRAFAHQDLRHFSGGVTSAKDLRGGGTGIKPSTLQMLFAGGTASKDLRSSHDDSGDMEALADGGEVDGDEAGEDCSEECIAAAEDIMDVLGGGGFYADRPSDSDSKVERASKEASRRAKAEMLAKSLRAFFLLVDED